MRYIKSRFNEGETIKQVDYIKLKNRFINVIFDILVEDLRVNEFFGCFNFGRFKINSRANFSR